MDDLRRLPAVRRALVVLAAASGSAALAASAQAGSPAQPVSSAIAQYVEMIPTGEGVQAAGVGAPRTTKLPPKIARQIRKHAGADAATLEQVATSSAYGAPAPAVSPPAPVVRPAAGRPKAPSVAVAPIAPEDRPVPPTSFAHALAVAVAEPLSGGFASVWLGLVIVTAAAFVAARRARGSPEVGERGGGPEHR